MSERTYRLRQEHGQNVESPNLAHIALTSSRIIETLSSNNANVSGSRSGGQPAGSLHKHQLSAEAPAFAMPGMASYAPTANGAGNTVGNNNYNMAHRGDGNSVYDEIGNIMPHIQQYNGPFGTQYQEVHAQHEAFAQPYNVPARQLTQFAYGGPGPDIGTYGVDLTSQQPSPHAQARRRGLVHLSPEYSIFVGRLGPEVDESLIWSTFSPIYQSFVKANLVRSRETGESKGYAFVRFTNPVERDHALATMDGAYIGNSVIAVSNAHREDPRHAPIQATGAYLAGRQQSIHMLGGYQNGLAMLPGGGVSLPVQTGQQLHAHALAPPPTPVDPRNITVFVGGLPSGSTMEQLRRVFAPGGRIKHISIPDGKSCAFIKYSEHQEAAGAIVNLQGAPLNGARLRLAWGKHAG